jgi:hypothetical protein
VAEAIAAVAGDLDFQAAVSAGKVFATVNREARVREALLDLMGVQALRGGGSG